jgi:hypothetical protein
MVAITLAEGGRKVSERQGMRTMMYYWLLEVGMGELRDRGVLVLVVRGSGRMRDIVVRVTGFDQLHLHMATLAEPFYLDLDDISNVVVLSKLLNRVLIDDYPAGAYVERAVDPILTVVLHKGLNNLSHLELSCALNVPIDKRILSTKGCVTHYLVENGYRLEELLSMLVELVIDLKVSVLTLHSLVDLGQIEDVLGCILDHIPGQRSPLPKSIVITHHGVNFLLLGVNYVNVLLEELGQGYVVVIEIQELLCVVFSLLDDTVSDLGIKDEVTNKVVLVYKG